MYLDTLSASLTQLCEEMGLSYKDASRRCHCSPHYFNKIIQRESTPTLTVLENLCDGFGKTPNCLLRISSDTERDSYRTAKRVKAVRAYCCGGETYVYPVCPRCDLTMEREYQSYCDRCGQKLSWRGFDKVLQTNELEIH